MLLLAGLKLLLLLFHRGKLLGLKGDAPACRIETNHSHGICQGYHTV